MVALITGCSTGMGHELCAKMKDGGFTVIATARDIDSLLDVKADDRLSLDVTDSNSIKQVYDYVVDKYGRLDFLVNNAGYSVRGALEEVDLTKVKEMFDVNVFGMIGMIQMFAGLMRKTGTGKVVNIGSVSGRYTQAANGCYCASKHAVEAITEALRAELKKFNVQVTVIEPGPVRTSFFKKVAENSDALMRNTKSPYYDIYEKNIMVRENQKNETAICAADEIYRIITKKKLRTRYFIAMNRIQRIGIKCLDIIK